MLVALEVHVWGARATDDAITKEVAEKYQSKTGWGSYRKKLAEHPALDAVKEKGAEIKRYHKAQTLPWDDRFHRVLLAKNFEVYSNEMRKLTGEFESLTKAFGKAYEECKEQAKTDLNGLYREDDYPSKSEILQKFKIKEDIACFPEAADFRVSLQNEEVERIKSEMSERLDETVKTAMTDVWGRLYSQVERMAERLGAVDEPLRRDYVGDLESLLDLLPNLNLTGDKDLARIVQEAKLKLTAVPTEAFRKAPGERKKAAEEAENILATMAGYTGGK
jgi:hypothetical protein